MAIRNGVDLDLSVGGVPIIDGDGNYQDGEALIYTSFDQTVGGPAWVPSAVPQPSVPTAHQWGVHILVSNITTVGSEVVLGHQVLDPSTFGVNTGPFTFSVSFKYLATINDGGGSPTFVINVYDVGAPNSPQAGVLRATFPVQGAPFFGQLRYITRTVSAVSSPGVGSNEIHDVERVYEYRGQITGAGGDTVDMSWLGVAF